MADFENQVRPTPYVKDGEVGIASISVTYVQENDTNGSPDEEQYLTLETSDVPSNEDYPFYYNMKIPTHWSFNSIDDLAKIVKDFEARVKLARS